MNTEEKIFHFVLNNYTDRKDMQIEMGIANKDCFRCGGGYPIYLFSIFLDNVPEGVVKKLIEDLKGLVKLNERNDCGDFRIYVLMDKERLFAEIVEMS